MRPDYPRVLYFDLQVHRNDVGGYDHDADELMSHFIFDFIGPFVTEFHAPRCHARNRKVQRNDVPDSFTVMPSPEKGEVCDVRTLQA